MDHINRQRHAKTDIDQNVSHPLSRQVHIGNQTGQGDHVGLERDHHRHDDQHKADFAETALGTCQLIGCHRCQQHDHDHGTEGIQQGVADQHRKLKFRPGLNVHSKTPALRKSQEILDHVIVRLEGVDKNKYQRHQPENRAKENDDRQCIDLSQILRFFIHYASTSLLLVIFI